MKNGKVETLLTNLQIEYKNLELYERAFSHTSYVNEAVNRHLIDNERLEYLGDACLNLVIAEYLYNYDCNLEEGKMTKLRARYVCESALFSYSKSLHFNEYIKLGRGEKLNNGANRPAILADAFEAFIAAIYLDLGLEHVKKFVYTYIIPMIESHSFIELHDYKTELQELVQADKRTIMYEIVGETGPAHNKIFVANVMLDDILLGEGLGKTKKEAEQMAAKSALDKLAKRA